MFPPVQTSPAKPTHEFTFMANPVALVQQESGLVFVNTFQGPRPPTPSPQGAPSPPTFPTTKKQVAVFLNTTQHATNHPPHPLVVCPTSPTCSCFSAHTNHDSTFPFLWLYFTMHTPSPHLPPRFRTWVQPSSTHPNHESTIHFLWSYFTRYTPFHHLLP